MLCTDVVNFCGTGFGKAVKLGRSQSQASDKPLLQTECREGRCWEVCGEEGFSSTLKPAGRSTDT